MAKKIVLKRSRKSYIGNYILAIAAFLTLLLVNTILELSSVVVYILLIPIIFLFLEPEFAVIHSTYIIGEDNILEIKGIITKKTKTIPWRLAAYTTMKKGVMGRIFDFGDIVITSASGAENKVILRGIDKPGKILEAIEERMRKHKSL